MTLTTSATLMKPTSSSLGRLQDHVVRIARRYSRLAKALSASDSYDASYQETDTNVDTRSVGGVGNVVPEPSVKSRNGQMD
jgi:hypothetical protein